MTVTAGTTGAAKAIDPAGALYQQRAARALPLLVRQAEAGGVPITYEQLARELDIPNPRNLNYVLGSVGVSLSELSAEWNQPIPPLQSLVISKGTGLPGSGFVDFLADPESFKKAPKAQRRAIITKLNVETAVFSRWQDVLATFSLEPWRGPVSPPSLIGTGQGGESPAHLAFKMKVSGHPAWFGIGDCRVETEHLFPTGDAIDVLFSTQGRLCGVEVKSNISAPEDLHRGLFQCIKYGALLRAECAARGVARSVEVFLACEGSFPHSLLGVAHALGVEVIDGLS